MAVESAPPETAARRTVPRGQFPNPAATETSKGVNMENNGQRIKRIKNRKRYAL
jgi:hypothetical protein